MSLFRFGLLFASVICRIVSYPSSHFLLLLRLICLIIYILHISWYFSSFSVFSYIVCFFRLLSPLWPLTLFPSRESFSVSFVVTFLIQKLTAHWIFIERPQIYVFSTLFISTAPHSICPPNCSREVSSIQTDPQTTTNQTSFTALQHHRRKETFQWNW